jgi:hypothetical protein
MQTIHSTESSVSAVQQAIASLVAQGYVSIQILGAVQNGWTPETLDPVLKSATVPVFGGLFPGVIYEGQSYESGFVAIGHSVDVTIVVLPFPDPPAAAIAEMQRLNSANTIFIYLDATCPSGDLTRLLYNELGATASWCGGGAGALDFVPRPVILTPDGLLAGVAVLAGMEKRASIGVTHGWSAFGNPMLVTESNGNDILSLDWRPAFDVYREIVEAHSGSTFDAEGFFQLASVYPLMLETFGGEGIVRDPLAPLPDGGLRCAGDMPVHSMVRVANGNPDGMLAAAGQAQLKASSGHSGAEGSVGLTINCISRALLLRERLANELQVLRIPNAIQAGALTIGEFASAGGKLLQVHNKTTVLAALSPSHSGT